MEPHIRVGSIVVIKPSATYEVGDVITFGQDTKTQIPTTHRIVATEGVGAALTFTTKGDANDAPDSSATSIRDVHGKVIFTVPYVGYFLAFAKTKLGFFLVVGIPALLVCLEEALNIIAEVRRMRSPKPTTRRVVDLRPQRPMRPQPMQRGALDIRIRTNRVPVRSYYRYTGGLGGATPKSIGMVVVLAVLIGSSTLSRVSGDTVSYYRSSQMSADNTLQAGTYDNNPPPLLKVGLFSNLSTGTSSNTTTATDTPPVDPSFNDASTTLPLDTPPTDVPVTDVGTSTDSTSTIP